MHEALRHPAAFALALTLFSVPAASQSLRSGGALIPAQSCYDVRSYRLELEVLPDDRRIEGALTMRADIVAATDTIVLDLHDALSVDKVVRDEHALHFDRSNHRRLG